MSPATSRARACARSWSIDRDTASRLGITPATIDQTLYDAYGQRQVSTMFTQLNQYHVMLEVMPGFQKRPLELRDLYIRTGAGTTAAGSGLVSGGSSASGISAGPPMPPPRPPTSIVTGSGRPPPARVQRRRRILRRVSERRPGAAAPFRM